MGSTGHAPPAGAPPAGSQEPGSTSSTNVDFMLTIDSAGFGCGPVPQPLMVPVAPYHPLSQVHPGALCRLVL